MDKLKEILCKELEEIAQKKELSVGDLDTVHKITDTIKNILKIEMLEDGSYSRDDGYSRDGEWETDMRGRYGRGNSYRMHYVRGHYSRDDGREYSRDEGREKMMEHMERMMRDASDGDKAILRRCMEQLEQA